MARFGVDLGEVVGNGVVDAGADWRHRAGVDGERKAGEDCSEDFAVLGVGLIVSEDDAVG